MRVLALTNLYPNPLQPLRAPFNRHQLRILAARVPVRVVAPISWTDELSAWRAGKGRMPAGRRVTLDGLTVDHPRYYFPPKILRSGYGEYFAASAVRAVTRAVAEFRPTVLFAPWAYPDGWAAVRFGRSLGLPVVVQVHGSDVKLLDQHPARRRPTADALTRADAVVAVSRDLADAVIALGADPGRVTVVYDGVDPDLFRPGDKAVARSAVGLTGGEPVVLFVGNLVPVKAVDVLIFAAAELRRTGLGVRLIIIGAGPLRAALEAQSRAAGVADRVTFAGGVPQTSLPDWYRAADVFCLPSRSEGVPNVLLETSACGTPWVASAVGGVPEIVGRGAGVLVPPGDPAALAAALRRVIESPPPRPAGPPKTRAAAVDELQAVLGATARG